MCVPFRIIVGDLSLPTNISISIHRCIQRFGGDEPIANPPMPARARGHTTHCISTDTNRCYRLPGSDRSPHSCALSLWMRIKFVVHSENYTIVWGIWAPRSPSFLLYIGSPASRGVAASCPCILVPRASDPCRPPPFISGKWAYGSLES
jgi:hypothetical protein